MFLYKNIEIQKDSCRVTYKGREVDLYPQAYRLLELLLENPDRMWSYRAIMEKLWSHDSTPTQSTVRSHIKDVRKALRTLGVPEEIIENVHGRGYRLKLVHEGVQQTKQDYEKQDKITHKLEIMSC
ncbi:MAG: winged helix-turn-helix domain-containing protein [Nostocaceae cyanobacterium]|nr:winged helix-turn-helix domain-containing protein [Nostocaceae cyanobacterium]